MQFGIEIPGVIKWSPAGWRYKYWGGVYKEKDRYINVNRGFGYLAFPGRVGMPPEITVIELKKKPKKLLLPKGNRRFFLCYLKKKIIHLQRIIVLYEGCYCLC